MFYNDRDYARLQNLSAAVPQGRDGSGLGGTLAPQHSYLQSTQLVSGEETATWDGFYVTHTQEEDVVLLDWLPVLIC